MNKPARLFGVFALAAVMAVVVAGVARGSTVGSAQATFVDPSGRQGAPLSPDVRRVHERIALNDLAELKRKATRRPLLPSLPDGWIYGNVLFQSEPNGDVTSFGLYLFGPDNVWGHYVIHMDEGWGTIRRDSKRLPIYAFAPFEHSEQLANGTWQVMQQQHEPWKGMWIYMALRGNLYIQVEGMFVPRDVLRDFVASLN